MYKRNQAFNHVIPASPLVSPSPPWEEAEARNETNCCDGTRLSGGDTESSRTIALSMEHVNQIMCMEPYSFVSVVVKSFSCHFVMPLFCYSGVCLLSVQLMRRSVDWLYIFSYFGSQGPYFSNYPTIKFCSGLLS